jgi:hypothetical protein
MPSYTQSILTPDPLYLQPKSYDARSDRKPFADILSQGVVGSGDMLVTLTSGMGISIASGAAWVLGANISDQGMYREYIAAAVPLTVTAADGANPRLDQVILRVLDTAADASGSSEARIEIVPGTPTAGATLVNRNGAANLTTLLEASKSVLLLADILVPAGAGSLSGGNLADRRVTALPKNSSLTGTLAARPLATAVPAGTEYFATDDSAGTLYRSNGATWVKISPSLGNIAARMAFTHGYGAAPDLAFRFAASGTLFSDTHSGSSWVVSAATTSFAFPVTGMYLVEIGSDYPNQTGGTGAIFLYTGAGSSTGIAARGSLAAGADASGAVPYTGISSGVQFLNVTAGVQYKLGGYYNGGSTMISWVTAVLMPLA